MTISSGIALTAFHDHNYTARLLEFQDKIIPRNFQAAPKRATAPGILPGAVAA
jgi:hypothetical protein